MQNQKIIKAVFISLVFLTLLSPFFLFNELLFPFTTSKGFVFRILVQLALPLYLYLVLADKALRPNLKNWLSLSVLAFFGASLLSSIFSASFQRSFWGEFERMTGTFFLAHLSLVYFFVLLLAKLSGNLLEKFLKTLVWVAVTLSLTGIISFFGGPVLMPDPFLPARSSSVFGNPIFFASFLILPMFLSAFFALQAQKKSWKWAYWLAVAVQLIGVFVSVTRGAVLGIAAGLIIAAIAYLILVPPGKVKKYGIAIALVFVALVSLVYIFPESLPFGQKVQRVFTLEDTNARARLILWQFSLQGFKDNPILGTGPESFFEVSNKYYEPEIRQYDSAWFDKPHNYLLELLITTGVLGIGAYLSMLLASAWVLYLAFRRQILTLLESVVLFAGFTAYQVQNLFVFDTVSASIVFFLFLGFLGYLHFEVRENQFKTMNSQKQVPGTRKFKPSFIFWPVLLVMLYVIYATNIIGLQASRHINFARGFQQVDPAVTREHFNKLEDLPFNVYLREWGKEHSDFSVLIADAEFSSAEELEEAKKIINDSVVLQQRVVEAHPNHPGAWLKLGNALFAKSLIEKTGFSQEAYDAGLKAVELAPRRTEPRLFLVIISIRGERLGLAEEWLNEMLADFPGLTEVKWQLGHIYYFTDRQAEGEKVAQEALAENYQLRPITQGDWLLTYYYDNNMPDKAVEVLEGQVEGYEEDGDYFARLADAYRKSGRPVEARAAALRLLELEPQSRGDVELFLQSLSQ